METESGRKNEAVRAGEYLSEDFQSYLRKHGIQSELTAAHSPKQNGVSECLNRMLMESAR